MPLIAIIDDEPIVVGAAASIVRRLGHETVTGGTIADAQRIVRERRPDILLLDMHLPDGEADEAVARLKMMQPSLRIILFSGDLELETSSRAVKAGAFEYLTKPFTFDSMSTALSDALGPGPQGAPVASDAAVVHVAARRLLGQSPEICLANLLLERFAKTPETPILITGESGTGKEVAAAAVHNLSKRREKPFIKLNCAAIPRSLMEAELFGHERGSFTDAKATRLGVFEAAHGGTLFLDEVGELDIELQPKLLRVLEEKIVHRVGGGPGRAVDVRVVAATNRNLAELCRAGRFREDLYFRLAVLHIELTPLRSRREDIPLLAEHFLRERSQALGRVFTAISPPTMRMFIDYEWPGNVREMRNLLERLVILSPKQGVLDIGEDEWRRNLFGFGRGNGTAPRPDPAPGRTTPQAPHFSAPAPVPDSVPTTPYLSTARPNELLPLDEAEKRYILEVIARMGNNKTAAAKVLGIARSTLNRKLAAYGLSVED
ncbi:MAG: sigma-54 dependent transcriptional regulator [Candidatus Sumerlaeia bacterium]|nr:sigma-54 dependent transcriptional regulator [Candidatus Sumerlaeia bacterium]